MIYFDNSATTKPKQTVIDSYTQAASRFFANPSSLHSLGAEAEKLLSASRRQAANLLQVQADEVIFTSGGTEGNNLAIKGTAFRKRKTGNHIITTAAEHPSVLEAFADLEQEGFEVTILAVNRQGYVSVEAVKQAITNQTILVSVMHVNNELGTVQPVQTIGRMLQEYPSITFHVDNVQGFGKLPLDLKYIDLCTISAHKFHGLRGSGLLVKKSHVQVASQVSGGGQEAGLRSGTENVAGIAAMVKAMRLAQEQMQQLPTYLFELKEQLRTELDKMDKVIVHSPKAGAPHILNFSVPGIKPEVLIHALAEHQIFVSTKSACSSKNKDASAVLLACGVPLAEAESAVRVSFSYDNTAEEAAFFLKVFKQKTAELMKIMG